MVRIVDFVDEGLGHSSYLVDLGDGSAAVIGPPRFPTTHEALASRSQLDSPHEAVADGQRVDLDNGCWLIPVARSAGV